MVPARRATAALLALVAVAAPGSALVLVAVVPEGPCADVAAAPVAGQLACGRWDPMPSLPEPREALGLAFARSNGPVPGLLFAHGGRGPDGTVHGDLWMGGVGAPGWVARAHGPPRADAVFVFDDTHAVAYLFGGRDAAGARGDLWVYDAPSDAWSRVATPPGPGPRYGAAGAFDPETRTLWIFGGTDGATYNGELWSWDADDNTWALGPNAPQARSFASGAWDHVRDAFEVHGGEDEGTHLPDHWVYRPASGFWSAQIGSAQGIAHAAATWWPQRTNLVELGGIADGATTDRAALYGAEGDFGLPVTLAPAGVWLAQAPLPSPRADARAAWEVGIGVAVLVGGRTALGTTAEAWIWFPGQPGTGI